MTQLSNRCVEESLRLGEDEDELNLRLEKAHEILYGIWYSAAPRYAKDFSITDNKELSPDEKDKIEKASHLVWERCDVRHAFLVGTKSHQFPDINKSALIEAAADYLAKPYLMHPVFDWIFLDMSISFKILSYGEHLKQNWLPGKRDCVGIHDRYTASNGNLSEMTRVSWDDVFEQSSPWIFGTLAFALGEMVASMQTKLPTMSYWVSRIYFLFFIYMVVTRSCRLIWAGWRKLRGFVDPVAHAFELWEEMYKVWKLLEGPVVNPANVREAMVESKGKGVVWDNAAWSIIDRVVATDAAVWVVRPTT